MVKLLSRKFVLYCIHNNTVIVELLMNGEYWDDGLYLNVEGCKLCIESPIIGN